LKTKALFLVLAVIIAVFAYLYTRPQQPVLSIDKVYDVTEVGKTVMVNVTLGNVPACGGWLIDLVWDPYIATLTTGGPNSTTPASGGEAVVLIDGPFLRKAGSTRFMINSANNTKGEAVLGSLLSNEGQSVSGTGVILMINFTIVRVGTTTIEMKPPSPTVLNQSWIIDASNHPVDHIEVNGLITEKGPPPVWAVADFQSTLIVGEVVVLLAASAIVYQRTHPRPPKSVKRKVELQPVVDPEDQV
jgi:hypothetical protein